jgi:hypothetical protein
MGTTTNERAKIKLVATDTEGNSVEVEVTLKHVAEAIHAKFMNEVIQHPDGTENQLEKVTAHWGFFTTDDNGERRQLHLAVTTKHPMDVTWR